MASNAHSAGVDADIPDRYGPLVRTDRWDSDERDRVDDALEYASEMVMANPQTTPERPGWFWWDRFDAALREGYPAWKWERDPQLGLGEFSVAAQGGDA